jgi:hypothetical protein
MKLKNVNKERKNIVILVITFSPRQMGGFLPALISAAVAV